MVHKAPGSDKWELAMRSRKLWEMFAENLQHQGMNPLEMLGWKKTGDLISLGQYRSLFFFFLSFYLF